MATLAFIPAHTVFSKSDLQKPRSPTELAERCSELFDYLASDEEAKKALRRRTGLCKPLVEEVWPAAIWSLSLYGDRRDVSIGLKLDSGQRDGEVTTPEGIYPIEITQAHTGESEHLRVLHLEEHGWAPGPLSEMKKVGTKRTGIAVTPGRTLGTMAGHLHQSRELIVRAVRSKAAKPYMPGTRLIVMFEDFVVKDEEGIESLLLSAVQEIAEDVGLPFSHVYLVGWSQKLFFTFENES